ncbi:MAG: pantetheine-phosphate adenylyltransferase [Clostridia bacterium]|nr:pantetheine-phosphate adenylyltransferase [Clostridia bacterium]
MKKAVFAGTFDPVTLGHEEIIKRASALFDEVYVALCINPDKTAYFSLEKRLEMLKVACKPYKNVKVVYHEGLLVDLMKQNGIIYNVRGLRNSIDFEYEEVMHRYNQTLYPQMQIIYLPCENNFVSVSSTAVRNAYKNGESLENYLSAPVCKVIKK